MSEAETGIDISKLSDREKRVLLAIAKGLNGQSTAQDIAYRLRYRPARSGTLACTKTLRSLEARKIVGRIAPRDQWSSALWFLSSKANAVIQAIKKEIENNG
ncbi:hypothetical protein [Mesorhizobium sp. SP-1A]|uniref:hypothetical protein n=1 Tax=Mesorhizobium sp. SP-1A TaxID=3077840 RepID=UPI0028F6EBA2|nr:hypothetical protein [Mesorhizobium sp. SP-1A]